MKTDALAEQAPVASPLVREAMTRLLSSSPRGFTPEQRLVLSDYKEPIQSGNPSDQVLEQDRLS